MAGSPGATYHPRVTESSPPVAVEAPSIERIQRAWQNFAGGVRQTPAWRWRGHRIDRLGPDGAEIQLKLELLQHTGTFKPRGVLTVMRELSAEQRGKGVVAVSAGNHGMAVAYGARTFDTVATVAMPKTANPARVAACRAMGAEVVLTDTIADAFAAAEQLERDGLTFVHPFEGPLTALGNATLGLEFLRQVGNLDFVLVAIGGGGLAAGVAAAVKQLQPRCRVIGVEPEGADSMHRSFAANAPQQIDRVTTIADSLGSPRAMPYSFGLCRRYVDEVMLVSDDEICRAMALLFADAKLAVEPAGAATTAALLQCREELAGKKVGVIVCGSNVDPETFAGCLQRGRDGVI
ncbi:MAG: threonine/serine dehydratase [Planctomycetes bacterium]|nr:threonine/serine dehydratase [Planctomycetota bacterium]